MLSRFMLSTVYCDQMAKDPFAKYCSTSITIHPVLLSVPKAVFFNLFEVAEPKMTLKNLAEPKSPSN